MSATIRPVEYFTVTVHEEPEAAYELLGQLATSGINLLAFNAIPAGLRATQLVLFPEDRSLLEAIAEHKGLDLIGPDRALLILGDDELGALARIHRQLTAAGVHPFASSGVIDGKGGFGYVVYLRGDEFERAARALGL